MQCINMAITLFYSLMTCVLSPSQVFTTLFKPREISNLVRNSILFVHQPTSAERQQAAVFTVHLYFRIVFSLEQKPCKGLTESHQNSLMKNLVCCRSQRSQTVEGLICV